MLVGSMLAIEVVCIRHTFADSLALVDWDFEFWRCVGRFLEQGRHMAAASQMVLPILPTETRWDEAIFCRAQGNFEGQQFVRVSCPLGDPWSSMVFQVERMPCISAIYKFAKKDCHSSADHFSIKSLGKRQNSHSACLRISKSPWRVRCATMERGFNAETFWNIRRSPFFLKKSNRQAMVVS